MITLASLWLPILLSAVLVFAASALVWMALPHHKTDWKALPNEDAVRAALKGAAPGQYSLPFVANMDLSKDPAAAKKFEEGPVAHVTVMPAGPIQMGGPMARSFVYYLVVATGVAYVTGRTLDPGAEYLTVFRLAGTTAWFAFGLGVIPDSIWFGRPWSSTLKHLADSLLYALLVAGVFGWRWPDM
ncbi:MAG TPA: hypothetical protein VD793_04725 [Gemmatimonadales bacterium]|nr:hypothetical protein [Gemmatimonadales bacterium]